MRMREMKRNDQSGVRFRDTGKPTEILPEFEENDIYEATIIDDIGPVGEDVWEEMHIPCNNDKQRELYANYDTTWMWLHISSAVAKGLQATI